MESTQQSDKETYRAIVLGQGGNELLLNPVSDGFRLPSVEIPRWQRIAENLTAAMRKEWGHEVVCLFKPDLSAPIFSADDHNYHVMESHGAVAESSPRAEWVRVASLSEEVFVEPADYMAVRRSLTECAGGADGVVPGPFAKLGWFKELQVWIEEVIGPLGFHLTGSFAQLNASASFNLVRFETSGHAVWFKAIGMPNLREFPITLALVRLFPQYLPPILAIRPKWNGWLALEVTGTNLGETQDTCHWKAAVVALARLQSESISKCKELVEAGVRDLRADTLSALVQPFLDVMGQLMDQQTKIPPPILSRTELALLGKRIQDALSRAETSGVPPTLGHLDLNPGNIIVSHDRCVFLDWPEAYLGCPFFSFEYVLEHFRRTVGIDKTLEQHLIGSYAAQWNQVVSPAAVTDTLAVASLLAVFAYAAGNGVWNDEQSLQDPKTAGYLRGLTRRMNREANELSKRRSVCLS